MLLLLAEWKKAKEETIFACCGVDSSHYAEFMDGAALLSPL